MKLIDIQTSWEQDSSIDRTNLGEESLRIPQLHSKYFKIYSTERMRAKEFHNEYKKLYKKKYEYFMGTMSEEDLQLNNWEPHPLKILKTDIPIYMEADEELALLKSRIDLQEEKINFVESIIKSLSTRGFQIKSAIDWIKFTQGV